MILAELRNFKEKYDDSFNNVLSNFVKKNIEKFLKPMETGSNAFVLIRNSHAWRLWYEDDGFEEFIKIVQRDPNNKFYPKFLSKVREEKVAFKHVHGHYSIDIKYLKMELLQPIDPHSNIAHAINTGFAYICSYMHRIKDADDLKNLIGTDKEMFMERSAEIIKAEIEKNKDFFNLLIHLRDKEKANDIFYKNVMMRNNQQLVITDPIFK